MSINYPTSLDDGTSLPNPSATNDTNSPSLSSGQTLQNDAVIALETKLGITSATPVSGKLLRSTADGESTWDLAYPTGAIVGISDTQTLTNKTLTSPTINGGTISNPTLDVDAVVGYTTSDSGTVYGVTISSTNISAPGTLAVTGATTLSSTLAVTGATTLSSTLSTTGQPTFQSGTAIPSGGDSGDGILLSSTASFGVFFGSGAPTLSAAKGSLYLRSDGSSTSTRIYVNTSGSTTWTYLTSGA
jgi:hypothetical protein